jgi:hypothetical protein
MKTLVMVTGTRLWLKDRLLPSLRKTYTGDILIANYNDLGEEGKRELSKFNVIIEDCTQEGESIVIDRFRVFAKFLKEHLNDYDVVMHLDGCDMIVNNINPLLSKSIEKLTIFEDGGLWRNDKVIIEDLWHINSVIPKPDWDLVENKGILNPSLCGGSTGAMLNLFSMIADYCRVYSTKFGMDLYAVNIVVRAHNISYHSIPLDDKSIEHYGGYEEFKFKGLKESKDRREGKIK